MIVAVSAVLSSTSNVFRYDEIKAEGSIEYRS